MAPSARDLARVNGIGRQRPLRRGTTLTVPASIVSPAMAVLADNDPRASTGYVPQRTLAIPASLDGHSDAEGRLTVRVQRGQTLDMIAAEHGVTANDLRRWNHLDSSRLRRGQRLKVRVGEAAVEDTAARDSIEVAKLAHLRMPQPRHHRRRGSHSSHIAVTVRDGDTLAQIAQRNNVSVAQIKRLNGLTSNQVRSGQRLRIPKT